MAHLAWLRHSAHETDEEEDKESEVEVKFKDKLEEKEYFREVIERIREFANIRAGTSALCSSKEIAQDRICPICI